MTSFKNSEHSNYEAHFSVRMRASDTTFTPHKHVSGAERLCNEGDIPKLLLSLYGRAASHPLGPATNITINVERLSEPPELDAILPISTCNVLTCVQGMDFALRALVLSGVAEAVAGDAIDKIFSGPSISGNNMRGAMILCAQTGRRLDIDLDRGVRVSRIDMSSSALKNLKRKLKMLGFSAKTPEAVVIASKVIRHINVIAEYCCSDDPDYTGGYIASKILGYTRINRLKDAGKPIGGRAIFVNQCDVDQLVFYLEKTAVLFDRCGRVRNPFSYEESFDFLDRKNLLKE